MIGDKLVVRPEYFDLSKSLIRKEKERLESDKVICIGIGGESGSGKSTLAISLQNVLSKLNITNVILHQDDYFKLPPKSNHSNREKDINNVGTHEVDLNLLNQNIRFVKDQSSDILIKPLVNYKVNSIRKEFMEIEDVKIVLVEGTYALLLDEVDIRIFMSQDYKATKNKRVARSRDILSEFNERVLMIEHEIIRKHKKVAHYIIDSDYVLNDSTPSTQLGKHLWG